MDFKRNHKFSNFRGKIPDKIFQDFVENKGEMAFEVIAVASYRNMSSYLALGHEFVPVVLAIVGITFKNLALVWNGKPLELIFTTIFNFVLYFDCTVDFQFPGSKGCRLFRERCIVDFLTFDFFSCNRNNSCLQWSYFSVISVTNFKFS